MSKEGPSNTANGLKDILDDAARLKVYMLGHGVVKQELVEEFAGRFYGRELAEFFSEVWGPHLVERVRQMDASEGMTDDDAVHYAETAYNVLCSALYVQTAIEGTFSLVEGEPLYPPGFPPKIMPASRFRENLGFDNDRMTLLRQSLSFAPSRAAWRALARQATAADYVDTAYQESRRLRKARTEISSRS